MKSDPCSCEGGPLLNTHFPTLFYTEFLFMPAPSLSETTTYFSTQLSRFASQACFPSLPPEGTLHSPCLPDSPHSPALMSKALSSYIAPSRLGLLGIEPVSLPLVHCIVCSPRTRAEGCPLRAGLGASEGGATSPHQTWVSW